MADLRSYKCPCCGGNIEYNATIQEMQCPYCDTIFDLETLAGYDQDLATEKPDELNFNQTEESYDDASDLNVYVCKACGGEIVADPTTAATVCPYCDNPIVLTRRLSGELKPDFVIPFKLDKETAKRQLTEHLSDKKFLPKCFKDENHIDEIKGVYVPFWLYDADAEADIRYKATRIRSWREGSYECTETQYYSVLRSGTLTFSNVPVDGSEKMDNALMESLEPYDFSEAVDFQTAYLSGFLAERYDMEADACVARANERIKTTTEAAFAQTVSGYHTVSSESSSVRTKNGFRHYALYPVWLLNTKWDGKNYTFAMNGQTGKFVGDLPCDKSAYRKSFFLKWLLFAGISAGVLFLFSFLASLL